MYRLALDSATEFLSVALAEDGAVLAHAEERRPRGAENFLTGAAGDLLRQAGIQASDLGEIICTTGPGSFTGVRVGMAVALGLATGLNKPLLGLDTLRALVLAAPVDGVIAAVLDAKRNEIYAALFRREGLDLFEILPPRTETPAAFAARLFAATPVCLIGTAIAQFDAAQFPGVRFLPFPWLAPALLGTTTRPLLAPVDPLQVRVDYLRGADAKPMAT